MVENSLTKIWRTIKQLLIYQPPREPKPFVLKETKDEPVAVAANPKVGIKAGNRELGHLLRYAERLARLLAEAQVALTQPADREKIHELQAKIERLEREQEEISPLVLAYDSYQTEPDDRLVSCDLTENEKIIAAIYHLPDNKDIVMRQFAIPGNPAPLKAMIVYLDGMVNNQAINIAILQPLMLLSDAAKQLTGKELLETVINEYLPSNQTKSQTKFTTIADGINSGDTAIFIQGISEAIVVETKGYEHRGIDRPQSEQTVRGSQSAFSETLRANTALIRTIMPTNDLVTEMIVVGERVPLNAAIMYLKSLANPELVAEVKRRLRGVVTDYVPEGGMLIQYIEDHPGSMFPQSLSTERPDRVAANLAEGRVAILLHGTPFVHIVPVNFLSFFQSIEDYSLKKPGGTFMRVLRLVGTLLSVILPSLYLAISYFHQEALPTELVLAIAGARERVPFPAIVEVLLMEFSFELIREAGLRIPGALGSTIGIVGAIVLGQAAVTANIVSPIMVVIIAITGLGSFTIPDYRLAFSFRISRFCFLALAATLGLVGVAFGLLLFITQLCSMKSFGMPFLAPISPKTMPGLDIIARGPVFRQERRPDQLNTRDEYRQPPISRKWTKEPPIGSEDNP